MATPNPSITFNGNAEEAFNFYKSIFGGEFTSFMRWKDMPGGKTSAEDAEKIMHASLPIGKNNVLMGEDMPSAMRSQFTGGKNFMISLECESKDEAANLYHALLAGGGKEDPMMPLREAFWGAYSGFLTDKFGIRWNVNYTYPKK